MSSEAEKTNSSHVLRALRLTLLTPDLVELVPDGRGADRVALPALLVPVPWVSRSSYGTRNNMILVDPGPFGLRDPETPRLLAQAKLLLIEAERLVGLPGPGRNAPER